MVLEIEQRDAIRWLWLNRPARRNALDDELVTALDDGLADAESDPGTSVIVVAGRGPSFCAGADLRHLLALDARRRHPVEFLRRVSALFGRLEASPLPVVAAVHGHAVAGGLELALACDVVLAAEDALIGDGHVRRELLPGGGATVRLARAVGPALARWLMLTGELAPAAVYATAGWLQAVVPPVALWHEAQARAEQLAATAGPAQRAIKPLLARASDGGHDAALELELDVFEAHWQNAPVAEALRAFLASRPSARAAG